MKTTFKALLLSTLACAFVFSVSAAFADGDGECTQDPPYAKAALKRAKEAESAGKPVQAFLLYEKIYFCLDKNGIRDLEAGKKRILRKFALAQEKKGIIQTGEDYFRYVQDARCAKLDNINMNMMNMAQAYDEQLKGPDTDCVGPNRAEFNQSAGAFDILWQGKDYAEADAVLMKGVKAKPTDFALVKFSVEHFTPSDGYSDAQGYTADPAYIKELRRIAAQNTDDLLVKEAQSFSDKTVTFSSKDAMSGLNPVNRSLKLMGEAKDWASLADKQSTDKVLARAKKRAAETVELDKDSPSPVNLSDAISFYMFLEDEVSVEKLKALADMRGEQAASKGDMREAIYYFGISGNQKRADELSGDMKKDFQKKNPVKDIIKGDKDKKQFKKETDDLEKELGM